MTLAPVPISGECGSCWECLQLPRRRSAAPHSVRGAVCTCHALCDWGRVCCNQHTWQFLLLPQVLQVPGASRTPGSAGCGGRPLPHASACPHDGREPQDPGEDVCGVSPGTLASMLSLSGSLWATPHRHAARGTSEHTQAPLHLQCASGQRCAVLQGCLASKKEGESSHL